MASKMVFTENVRITEQPRYRRPNKQEDMTV